MNNRRISLSLLMTLLLVIFWSCSRKLHSVSTGVVAEESVVSDVGVMDEEGAVQEPAGTYYERLSYAFGADSTCVGMRNDMDFPEWYSGCFVNDRDRLTINVIGDTLKLRRMLTELLDGNEFDLGLGVCSKKEQIKVRKLLNEAVAENYKGNMTSGSNEDGTISVTLQGENDSVVERFKRDVFDSPILRFKVAEQVGLIPDFNVVNTEVEVNQEHESLSQFPGGEAAMDSYIYDNMQYPKEAYDNYIQGRVYVKFLVRETGIVDSIKILKSKDSYLDAEALRIVSTFPKFIPGKWDDASMDKWMTLPVMFKISDYEERKNKKYPAFQYDNGDDYVKDGLYRIVDDRGKIGYADEKGNTIIAPRFAFGFPFEDGKAKVTDTGQEKDVEGSRGEYHYWESDDWYYIDKTGRKID